MTFVDLDTPVLVAYFDAQRRRGLEERTIDEKRQKLAAWRSWLDGRALEAATYDDIERFLDGRRLGAQARYKWVSQLHVFYEFAVAHEFLDRDPTVRVIRPKLPVRFPRPIGDDDLRRALGAAPTAQTRAWLLLMAYAGFRCCEVARLERGDVLAGNTTPVLIVRGKGNKKRAVPAHPEILDALAEMPDHPGDRVFHRPMGGSWPAKHLCQTSPAIVIDALTIDTTSATRA